jgi:cohesin complex subunit SA-1/2
MFGGTYRFHLQGRLDATLFVLIFVTFQYYNDYGDIIKATLGKAREINKTNCARTMAISLTMLFRELQRDGIRINRQSEDFVSLKVILLLFQI